MAFIFDPSKGETPESLRKKREVAEALRANAMGLASSPGEGLAMIGAALGSRMADGRANKAAAYGQQQASSAMAPILAAFGGGSPAPSAPQPSVSNNIPIGKADPLQSVMDAAPKAAPGGDWLKYANSGATRNLPLSENLKNALGFLPELGVTMEVFSGGQPGKGSGKPRVGSTRHDHGNAADVFFYKDGKRLNWANPQDQPIFQEIVRRGKANGITGFGAGDGYMQPGSMHLGFGSSSVWGAGGKGANAPDWLTAAYNGAPSGRMPPAAQAVTAMAQGGQNMPQATPQAAPQPMARSGGAMDVWRGLADQGTASDGSQLVRTPDGVQRTSTKGYSEIIRPEGMPSEREPMPMRGQGGGMGAILSSLLGRGQPQAAPQMAQAMPQQVAALPMQPERQPVPQGQPPIPGIQPSPQPVAPAQQPMAAQPAPAPQQAPQAGMGGLGLPQLLQIAQNPWVAENKLYGGIINTLIENQLNMNKPMNPMEKAQLEKLLVETERLRNPQANPPAGFQELQMRAEAAGLQPGTPEYSAFMENGGGVPATFRALDMQAQAAGFQKGTPEYNEFMATRGAGLQAGAKTTAENLADIATGGAAEGAKDLGKASIAAGTAAWEGYGKVQTNLANIDEAIAAIDRGANSGLVYNMLPSVTEASASLTNAMNRMGLDVIGSVTFGALSEGEMRLAMETAVPQGLAPPELRQWLVRKRDAQQKAAAMMANAAQFLTVPGNTLNDWIAKNKAEKKQQSGAGPVVVDGYTIEQVD